MVDRVFSTLLELELAKGSEPANRRPPGYVSAGCGASDPVSSLHRAQT